MCSTSHAIRELQITMRHHWIPIATAKIQKPCYTKCWKGCGARGTLILWWECKIVQPLWQRVSISYKTKHILTKQPSNHFLWYSPQWTETFKSTEKPAHRCFLAALFMTAKTWKQPTCRRMEKNCGTLRNEIVFGVKKKWAINP